MGAVVVVLFVLVAVLAAGCIALWGRVETSAPSDEPDLAAPYREGLHAAIRLQTVAQELEGQLYTEAMRVQQEPEP